MLDKVREIPIETDKESNADMGLSKNLNGILDGILIAVQKIKQ